MSKKPVVVIAFGGNALIQKGQDGTAEQQMENIKIPMRKVVALAPDYRVVISHGNGPQVGNILLQQDSTTEVSPMPVDVVGAMTQGQIGYMIEAALERTLAEAGLERRFLTVITMVEVDENDPLFQNPTKPIGIVAYDEIKQLVDMDWILICSGGGGSPVVKDGDGHRGVEAVIDKDLASALLAQEIGADLFIIATDVSGAAINWGKPDQEMLRKVSLAEMHRYVEEGQFPAGSMGPKVNALLGFVEATSKRAIICSIDDIEDAIAGKAGTEISK